MDVIETYTSGKSLRETGEIHGISHEMVRLHLKESGIQGRGFKLKLKDESYDLQQVVDRYTKGEYLKPVCEELGIPVHAFERLRSLTDEEREQHIRAKFFNKAEVGEVPKGYNTPCLTWIGSYNKGRPIYCLAQSGRSRYAYHYAYYLATGKWSKKAIKRGCGNDACVEHTHLVEGK